MSNHPRFLFQIDVLKWLTTIDIRSNIRVMKQRRGGAGWTGPNLTRRTPTMTITINRNRALTIARCSFLPATVELGNRLCRYFDNETAAVSVILDGDAAEQAAGVLLSQGMLTDAEECDYAFC
jgi:hypothetical protein